MDDSIGSAAVTVFLALAAVETFFADGPEDVAVIAIYGLTAWFIAYFVDEAGSEP